MSEFILRDMVAKRGIADQFEIASAATSREEIGNPVYPPAVRKLREHGIDPSGKRARQMTKQDYEYYDYLLTAEQYNIQNMLRIVGGDPEHKIHRLLDYSKHPRDIDDPWYSGDFETAYRDIVEGCEAFLEFQMNKNDCEAAESIADAFLRMACVNCNFADASGKRTSDSPTYLRKCMLQ